MFAHEWVSAEFQRLADAINEYDQHLWLEMVPPNLRDELIDQGKVFRIVDDRNNSTIMHADSLTRPDEILAALYSSDCTRGSVLNRLDAHNKATEELQRRARDDARAAAMDLTAFVMKNTKSRWEHNGKIYDDEFRNLGPKTTVID